MVPPPLLDNCIYYRVILSNQVFNSKGNTSTVIKALLRQFLLNWIKKTHSIHFILGTIMRTIIRKPLLGLLALSLGSLLTTSINADLSGTVYRDLAVNGPVLNTYGIKDSNELGVTGITVTAFDSSGSVVGDTCFYRCKW